MNTENKLIKQLVQRHVNEGRNRSRWFPRPIIEVFEESFGKYRNKIYSIADFTSKTLFTQAEFYKQHFANDPENRIGGLKAVVNFYRWLVREYPDHDFFANDFSMSEHLLFNQLLSELLERNFYFTTLNPNNIPYGKEKVCFLLRGLDNQSTRIVNDDHVSIDYSVLRSRFYRDLLIEFTTTSQTVSAVKWVGIPYYICDGMQALYSVKQSKDYPNPNLGYLTNQEAIFIRQYFDAQDVGLRT